MRTLICTFNFLNVLFFVVSHIFHCQHCCEPLHHNADVKTYFWHLCVSIVTDCGAKGKTTWQIIQLSSIIFFSSMPLYIYLKAMIIHFPVVHQQRPCVCILTGLFDGHWPLLVTSRTASYCRFCKVNHWCHDRKYSHGCAFNHACMQNVFLTVWVMFKLTINYPVFRCKPMNMCFYKLLVDSTWNEEERTVFSPGWSFVQICFQLHPSLSLPFSSAHSNSYAPLIYLSPTVHPPLSSFASLF